MSRGPYQPLQYGVIATCNGRDRGMAGSIDFMCAPRSTRVGVPALLDDARGGRFSSRRDGRRALLHLPARPCVLLTRFLSDACVAEVSDFMLVEKSGSPTTRRRAKTVRGEVPRMLCSALR